MSVGSTMAYVQRKLPASGLTVTDTGSSPAVAVGATAAATAAAANRRAIHVPRIKRSSTGDRSGPAPPARVGPTVVPASPPPSQRRASIRGRDFRPSPEKKQPQVPGGGQGRQDGGSTGTR